MNREIYSDGEKGNKKHRNDETKRDSDRKGTERGRQRERKYRNIETDRERERNGEVERDRGETLGEKARV